VRPQHHRAARASPLTSSAACSLDDRAGGGRRGTGLLRRGSFAAERAELEAECQWLNKKLGTKRLLELTSNPALTNFTLPKLLWVRTHEPDAWKRVRHVLLPKDFVRLRLSGEYAIDVADASGTLMLDVAQRRWSQEVIDAAGIDSRTLPRVFESPDICAHVSARASSETGLVANTPIVAGAGDQAAGAVGMGITRPGAVSVTIGTSGVVFAATDRPALDPKGRLHTFCHAIPDRWHVMGVTQAAGLSLRWMREQLGLKEHGDQGYDMMTREASAIEAGADGVLWAPYLMGERTPHLDAFARGGWIGLTAKHTRADLIRSLLEGVAYSQKDCLDIIEGMGVMVDSIRLSGGGARSGFWRQMFADVFGRRVATLETEEGSAYGAALLSMVGTGQYASVLNVCNEVIHETASLAPRTAEVDLYARGHKIYQALYPALKVIQ